MENNTENKNILLIGIISIFLGVIFTYLFFDQSLGVNFPIFISACACAGIFLLRSYGKPQSNAGRLLLVLACFFGVMVFVRSSELLTFFNFIASLLLLGIFIDTSSRKSLMEYLPIDYLRVFILPFAIVFPFFLTINKIFTLPRFIKKHPKQKEIVRGVIVSVVLLAIFTALFSSADMIFGEYISKLFSFDINIESEVWVRIITTVIVTAFCLGALGYMLVKKHVVQDHSSINERSAGWLEVAIVFSSINVLFFIFILFQISYLFGGVEHLLEKGLTYAEYARTGFYQLIAVAILSYLVISIAERFIIKNSGSHIRSFKLLSIVLISQVILILASAFVRLSLYEHAYGFSTIRLYSYALMVWLGVIMAMLSWHIITNGTRQIFARNAFVSVVALLIAMNMINPDAYIARRNIARYEESGKIDTEYLASLSSDAVPQTVRLLDSEVKYQFAHDLSWNINKNDSEGWKSFNLSSRRAETLLVPYMGIIPAQSLVDED